MIDFREMVTLDVTLVKRWDLYSQLNAINFSQSISNNMDVCFDNTQVSFKPGDIIMVDGVTVKVKK